MRSNALLTAHRCGGGGPTSTAPQHPSTSRVTDPSDFCSPDSTVSDVRHLDLKPGASTQSSKVWGFTFVNLNRPSASVRVENVDAFSRGDFIVTTAAGTAAPAKSVTDPVSEPLCERAISEPATTRAQSRRCTTLIVLPHGNKGGNLQPAIKQAPRLDFGGVHTP